MNARISNEPRASALLGAQISDRFVIEQVIGVGGQAWVFSACDKRDASRVALKVIRPELSSDVTSLLRFKREREELTRLPHPNVVAVLGHGVDSHVGPWIATELLRGETLASQIERGAVLTAPSAVSLIVRILEPLAILHEEGRAHRDLKPSNIFVEHDAERRRPVLLDFGICYRPAHDTASERLTQEGEAVGTLGYLAPEALYSTPTRVALLDVWSIGAILVEIVTGQRLVPREHARIPIIRSMDEWEDCLEDFRSKSDPKLTRIVAASLSADLADRPADARVLSVLLQDWLRESAPNTGGQSRP